MPPRYSNELECQGCSDNEEGCGKIFGAEANRTMHHNKGKPNFICPDTICTCTFTQKGDLVRHIRNKHPKNMAELNVKPVKNNIPPPTKYESRKDEWFFLKRNVQSNIQGDMKKKWNAEDQKFLDDKFGDKSTHNQANHDITLLIMELLDKSGWLNAGSIDTLGGILRNGLKLQKHGGLFQMSGDRLNNNRPHYIPGEDILANLQFIPMAFNCSSNIAGDHRENFCSFLRTIIRSQRLFPKTNEEIEYALANESRASRAVNGKQIHNKLYNCCRHIWQRDKDKKEVKASFDTLNDFFEAMKELLKEQKCRCAISNIFMLGLTKRNRHPFGMSVDATRPTEGHVKGNLRIVCFFMNSINQDNKKKRRDKNDGQSIWNRRSFERYLGVYE
jgi:hypothetical protein